MLDDRRVKRHLMQIVACAVYVVALGTPAAMAQAQGTLVVVRDTAGAVLPDVVVTVTGTALATPRTVVTNKRGVYELDGLPIGRYILEASLSGFGPQIVEIATDGSAARHDLVLAVSSFSERVTVTATKAGVADIQSTPIAITALPSATIEQLGIHTVEGLVGLVPTLTVSQSPGGRVLVTIRGIGTNSGVAGADPSSTIYLDNVYLARPAMASMDFLDTERVEVLRGPQGTLYGRNSVGGAVHMITRQPTNALETSIRLTAGSYNKLRAEGAVRGPLVKNRLMGSFAFLRGSRDGLVKDLDHPDHSLGSEDTWAGRGQLRVLFGSRSELLLSGDYGRFDGVPLTYAKPIMAKPGFSFDSPTSLWEVRASHLASATNIQRGAAAKLSAHLNGTTTLTSLRAYRKSNDRFFIDRDATELALLTTDVPDDQRQVSQELTVAQRRGKLTWIGGTFFFDERDNGPVEISDLRAGVQIRPFSTINAHAWALFGQATYSLTSRISLTGGVRYSDEEKDVHNIGGVYRSGTTILANPATFYDFVDSAAFHAWTPKASVQLQPVRDTFMYVSATRGFKSGGFNPSAPQPGRAFRPEFAWSYEAGVKRTLGGGRVRTNAAVFYNDYHDLQVQSFILPGVLDIRNAASATITGVEIEVAAAAWRGLQLAGNISWLDATYDRYRAVGPGNVTGDVAGNRLNNAPEWSGGGSAVYEFATGRVGTAFMRGDVSWQSRVFFTPFNDAIETQRAYGLLHTGVGFEPRSRRWELVVYARNLRNHGYITGTLTNVSLPAINGRPGEPRQWATQFTIRR
jgi:iron complex outermembrane recepter protein